MKNILRVLALCMVLLLPALALAGGETACYWQLEAIEVDNQASGAYGPASAQTSASAVTETDPAAMTEIVRGVKDVTLDITRAAGGYNAHGRYECITEENMIKCTQVVVEIIKQFAK